MDFKGQYLTYDEYEDLEGTLDEVPFNLLEYDARKRIDERTQGRLINVESIPEPVKICVFKMIDILNKYQVIENKDKSISSENIDGYSVTYNHVDKTVIEIKNKECDEIIESYLSYVIVDNVPLLYLGVKNVG